MDESLAGEETRLFKTVDNLRGTKGRVRTGWGRARTRREESFPSLESSQNCSGDLAHAREGILQLAQFTAYPALV